MNNIYSLLLISFLVIILLYITLNKSYITEHLVNTELGTNIQNAINTLSTKVSSINDNSQKIQDVLKGLNGIQIQNNINDLQNAIKVPLTQLQIQNLINNFMSIQNNITTLGNINTSLANNVNDLNTLISQIGK